MDMTLLHEMGPKDERHLLSGIPIFGKSREITDFRESRFFPGSNILIGID